MQCRYIAHVYTTCTCIYIHIQHNTHTYVIHYILCTTYSDILDAEELPGGHHKFGKVVEEHEARVDRLARHVSQCWVARGYGEGDSKHDVPASWWRCVQSQTMPYTSRDLKASQKNVHCIYTQEHSIH